jgi:hypothetical protein
MDESIALVLSAGAGGVERRRPDAWRRVSEDDQRRFRASPRLKRIIAEAERRRGQMVPLAFQATPLSRVLEVVVNVVCVLAGARRVLGHTVAVML